MTDAPCPLVAAAVALPGWGVAVGRRPDGPWRAQLTNPQWHRLASSPETMGVIVTGEGDTPAAALNAALAAVHSRKST